MSNKIILTTSDIDLVNDAKKIIFLTEGSKQGFNHANLHNKEYEVMDNIWKNRAGFKDAYDYCVYLFHIKLKEVRKFLNNYHGINKSEKYYQILLWHWLLNYIFQSYDKFITLSNAKEKYPDYEIPILKELNYVIPIDTDEFQFFISNNDKYHFQLYSKMAMDLNMKICFVDSTPIKQNLTYSKKISIIKVLIRFIDKIFNLISDCIYPKINKTLLSKPLFLYKKYFRYILVLKSKFKLKLDDFEAPIKFNIKKIDINKRKNLNKNLNNNLKYSHNKKLFFEDLLSKNIIEDLPLIYLEGFNQIRKLAVNYKVANIKTLLTAQNSYNYSSLYNFWFAENREKLDLIILQHGGNNCTHKLALEEIHWKIAKEIWTFGASNSSNEYPMYHYNSSIYLNGLSRKKMSKRNQISKILLVITSSSRYLRQFGAGMVTVEILEHLETTFQFLYELPEYITVTIRLPNIDYGWNLKERILVRNFKCKIIFDNKNTNFNSSIYNHDLCVTNYLGSTFIEAISLDFPVMALINDKFEIFHNNAVSKFKNLLDNDVIFNNPNLLAKVIIENSMNLNKLIDSKDRALSLEIFKEKFARTSEEWDIKWLSRLEYLNH